MDFSFLPKNNKPLFPSQAAIFAPDVMMVKCPGFENRDDCYFPTTTRTTIIPGQSWKCPEGFFCYGPNAAPIPCTSGFYCPSNTSQPIFCPPKYVCSSDTTTIKLCPEGFYCPIGTIKANKCWLSECPSGTDSSPKLYYVFFFVGFILIVLAFFSRKNNLDRIRSVKHRHQLYERLLEGAEQKVSLKIQDKEDYEAEQKFCLSFKNLGLSLPGGLEIMNGVSGKFRPGRTVAIMGPSGSGKSTLLSLLTGKVNKTTGSILIDGKEENLSKYRKIVGFVPQEDIMLRELTVREVLVHSARMRLPATWSYEKVKTIVNDTITFLGLTQVTDTIIGDAEERGISGGQRKRVNIGMEMVSNPSILFLDEPTSGLDSSTSKEICKILKSVAKSKGISVIAVIHSPSAQAFNQFDDLLLLAKGGRTVYFGPREQASSYFARIGFPCPRDCPLADHVMDVVSGKIKSQLVPNFRIADLSKYWQNVQSGLSPLPFVLPKCQGGVPGFKTLSKLNGNEEDLLREELLNEAEAFYQLQAGSKKSIYLRNSVVNPINMLQKIHSNRSSSAIINDSIEQDFNENKDFFKTTSQSIVDSYTSIDNSSQDSSDFKSKVSAFLSVKLTILTLLNGILWWMNDVFGEIQEVILETYNFFLRKKDPIRQIPSILKAFMLLFRRSCLQIYKTPTGFLVDLMIHLITGLLISAAIQKFDYWGNQPSDICANAPISLQVFCDRPHDDMQFAGIFICFGLLYAGISAGGNTFGNERVVFWRETSSGMSTLAYYIAKVLADVPRVLIASVLFTLGFSFFYPYRSSIFELGAIFTMIYLNAFGIGYFLSALLKRERVSLAGCGMSLLFGLLLSGVITMDELRPLLNISPAWWGIEIFWLVEVKNRAFVQDMVTKTPTGYVIGSEGKCYVMLAILAGATHILAFSALKLSNRRKKK